MPPNQTDRAATIAMAQLLNGAWIARVIHTAAELGIADHLSENPRDAISLADAMALHAPSLARLLRALAAIGVVHETEDHHYTLTPLGATLQSDRPGSLRSWARLILSEIDERPWQALPDAVRTGDYAFRSAFGTDAWTYRSTHPEASNLFDEAMQSLTQGANAAVVTNYSFESFGWIVDVGGGNGALILSILERHPGMRGTVFELSHVVEHTREKIAAADLASRCEVVEGDALRSVLAGADAYILKGVIHGRSDAESVGIYHNCRNAMPMHAKLLVMERVLPERIDPNDTRSRANVLVDINMMLMSPGGRERTEVEHRQLLMQAGLQIERIVSTSCPLSIIQAALVTS
jgi:hypothetical protein